MVSCAFSPISLERRQKDLESQISLSSMRPCLMKNKHVRKASQELLLNEVLEQALCMLSILDR